MNPPAIAMHIRIVIRTAAVVTPAHPHSPPVEVCATTEDAKRLTDTHRHEITENRECRRVDLRPQIEDRAGQRAGRAERGDLRPHDPVAAGAGGQLQAQRLGALRCTRQCLGVGQCLVPAQLLFKKSRQHSPGPIQQL